MVWNVILASGIIFLLCFQAPAGLFSFFPEVWSASLLVAWFFRGPRGLVVMLPVCWTALSAAWVIDGRLAPELQGRDLELTGVICNVPSVDAGVQRFAFVIDDNVRAPGVPARALINWYESDRPVRAGERWRLLLRLKRPRGTRNPGSLDFERWAFMRHIGATGYVRRSPVNRRLSPNAGRCALAAFRQRIASELMAAIPDAAVPGHMLALAVGIRDRLDQDDWTLLRRTGTAHLMAISGLHIGLAAGFMFFSFRQLGHGLLLAHIRCRPLVMARAGALSGAVIYGALAGFSLPSVRAMVMTGAVIALTGLRRSMPASQVLAVALYVILWTVPFAMLAPGFWLSFGAVFVLLLSGFGRIGTRAHEPGSRTGNMRRWLCRLFRAQWCLSLGLLPATAFFFGQISLVAPVANLLVVPVFAACVVPLLILGVIALVAVPPLAGPLLGTADFILARIMAFLGGLDGWAANAAAVDVPAVSAWVAGAGMVIAVVLIWPRPLPARMRILALLVVLAVFAGTRQVTPSLRIVVMDVGQGLAVLLQMPGYAVLFDTGPRYRHGDAGRSVVVPALRFFGVRSLDRLIVSHGDADHAGGARSVLAAYPEAELMAPERLDVASDRFRPCRAGQQWQRGDVNFRFLNPGRATDVGNGSENDASCVLLVQSAHLGLLLPGDIEQRAERRLVARGALPVVDLVIAPHHGSRTSSTPAFVAATRPAFVVFSTGYRNHWRFPAPDVLARWLSVDACALTTGDSGALVFEAQGEGPLRLVTQYRLDAGRIWNEAGPDGAATRGCRSISATN